MFENIPKVKVGIVAVSRDCFPESLSVNRRKALVDAYKAKYDPEDIYECPVCIVESEIHMVQALEDIKKEGCNALVVYLGNFGPEISETLLAKHFDGPKMFVAAAEETGNNLVSGRGDAYCGMLNASYNLQLRNIKAYIPEYPVGTAAECADMIHDFLPIARTVIGLSDLKIISFGPRPLNFLACNAPIKQLYNLGVEIEENSELDLFEAFNKHAGDPRIAEVAADMEAELGAGNKKPEILAKLDSEIERNVYLGEVSRVTGVEEEAIRSEIRKLVQKEDAAYQREAEKRQQNLKNYTPEGRRKDKGLLEAQRSLLYYAAQHQGIYDTLKEILEEDDFTEGIYWRTFGDIGDLWQNAGHVFPADLVSRFEDAKEQKQVTEIFAVQLPTENGADMEKAINEQVKRLKRTKIDHLTANAATVEEIQRLVEAKRKLDSLYITI